MWLKKTAFGEHHALPLYQYSGLTITSSPAPAYGQQGFVGRVGGAQGMRIPRNADIACGGNIVIGIAIKKFGYFYPAAIAILYFATVYRPQRLPDSCWWQEYENYPPAFWNRFCFRRATTSHKEDRVTAAYMHINQLASDLFWNAEFIPAIIHFSPEHRIFQIIFAFWREGFCRARTPDWKKSTVSSISNPTRHWRTPCKAIFNLCGQKPNGGACSASTATLVPGLSGEGDEARGNSGTV